jgi:hypothetical protein
MEDDYAAQFCKRFGAPAKPFRMELGALIIKERMQLTDEELVEQLKENPYLQFFIGLEAFQYSAPFDASMMVYFRKRLPVSVVNDCNERIVRHGLEVIKQQRDDDESSDSGSADGGDATACHSQSTEKSMNQGILLIDATCAPADIRYPTDLSLLNEARETTEKLIDAMHSQVRNALAINLAPIDAKPASSSLLSPNRNGLALRRSERPLVSSSVISSEIFPVLVH